MKQVLTASAFIHKDNKVLLIKRSPSEVFAPNFWELPGGHMDFGETVDTALKRESTEELGIEITVYDTIYSFTYTTDEGQSHYIEVTNLAVPAKSEFKIVLNPKEHIEYKWIAKLHELEEMEIFEWEAAAVTKGFEVMGWQ